MTAGLFSALAPQYWQAGLSAIPLRPREKMPIIKSWDTFGTRMPDAAEQADWMAAYPSSNIGLALGAASGVCMIDIDVTDEALIASIREICGPTPWVRVGKKGMALAYKWEQQRNFKLRGADGGMICEFLGLGNQVVLPGSIHPDTGRPTLRTPTCGRSRTSCPSWVTTSKIGCGHCWGRPRACEEDRVLSQGRPVRL